MTADRPHFNGRFVYVLLCVLVIVRLVALRRLFPRVPGSRGVVLGGRIREMDKSYRPLWSTSRCGGVFCSASILPVGLLHRSVCLIALHIGMFLIGTWHVGSTSIALENSRYIKVTKDWDEVESLS